MLRELIVLLALFNPVRNQFFVRAILQTLHQFSEHVGRIVERFGALRDDENGGERIFLGMCSQLAGIERLRVAPEESHFRLRHFDLRQQIRNVLQLGKMMQVSANGLVRWTARIAFQSLPGRRVAVDDDEQTVDACHGLRTHRVRDLGQITVVDLFSNLARDVVDRREPRELVTVQYERFAQGIDQLRHQMLCLTQGNRLFAQPFPCGCIDRLHIQVSANVGQVLAL